MTDQPKCPPHVPVEIHVDSVMAPWVVPGLGLGDPKLSGGGYARLNATCGRCGEVLEHWIKHSEWETEVE